MALTSGSLQGQPAGFEGVFTLSMATGPKPSVATAYVKGDRLRMETDVAGVPAAMIADGKGNLVMLISPLKQYSVMDMKSAFQAAGSGTLQFAKTGRRETIVGQACEYYTMTRTGPVPTGMGEACVTTELGFIGLNLGGRGSGMLSPADEQTMRQMFPSGFLVLKQLGTDGKLLYEVTKITRQPVPDSMFAPPAGFTEMKLPPGVQLPGE